MSSIKSFGEKIADALIEDALITPKQVEELLEQQKKGGARLLKLILEKGLVSDVDMAVSMGRVLNVPPINLTRISIPAPPSPTDPTSQERLQPRSDLA